MTAIRTWFRLYYVCAYIACSLHLRPSQQADQWCHRISIRAGGVEKLPRVNPEAWYLLRSVGVVSLKKSWATFFKYWNSEHNLIFEILLAYTIPKNQIFQRKFYRIVNRDSFFIFLPNLISFNLAIINNPITHFTNITSADITNPGSKKKRV